MTNQHLFLGAMLLSTALCAVTGCGAPSSADAALDPVDNVEQPIVPIHKIAVIQLSQTSNTSLTIASFGTFPADIARISHGQTTVQFDFYGPYHVTPAQVGCNGNANNDGPLLRAKALSMLTVAQLFPYKHIWFSNASDLQPACAFGSVSGGNYGQGFPNGFGYKVGYVTQFASGEVAVHEFLHGLNGPNMNTHLKAVSCTAGVLRSDNASCSFTEINPGGAPQGVWALGASTFGQNSATFNSDPAHNVLWSAYAWTPLPNVSGFVSTPGTYTQTLYPSDGPIPPSGNYTALHLRLPYFNGATLQQRYIWFDYRQNATLGNNQENRPGIYMYYAEDALMTPLGYTQPVLNPDVSVMKIGGSNPANYNGLQPIPVGATQYAVPGEPYVTVQVPAACAATCQLTVRITGPLL